MNAFSYYVTIEQNEMTRMRKHFKTMVELKCSPSTCSIARDDLKYVFISNEYYETSSTITLTCEQRLILTIDNSQIEIKLGK